MTTLHVAAVQAAPVFMDREATIERVGELVSAAVRDGAELAVFPEAFVPVRQCGSTPRVSGTATRSGTPYSRTRRWRFPDRDLASPVVEEEKVVSAELDLDQIALERRMFDPVGHHNRPDVFRLAVDTMARRPVVEVPLSAEKLP
jgi:predicted amidohydrolase